MDLTNAVFNLTCQLPLAVTAPGKQGLCAMRSWKREISLRRRRMDTCGGLGSFSNLIPSSPLCSLGSRLLRRKGSLGCPGIGCPSCLTSILDAASSIDVPYFRIPESELLDGIAQNSLSSSEYSSNLRSCSSTFAST